MLDAKSALTPEAVSLWIGIVGSTVGVLQTLLVPVLQSIRDRSAIRRRERALESATRLVTFYAALLDVKQRVAAPDEMLAAAALVRADLDVMWRRVRTAGHPEGRTESRWRLLFERGFLLWAPMGLRAWLLHAIFYGTLGMLVVIPSLAALEEDSGEISVREFLANLPYTISYCLVLLGITVFVHTFALRRRAGQPTPISPPPIPARSRTLKRIARRLPPRRLVLASVAIMAGVALGISWDPVVPYNRGIDLYNGGDYPNALEQFSRAIEQNPFDVDAYAARADTYSEMGRNEEAVRDYTRGLRFAGNDAELYSGRGRARAALARHKEAIEDYSRAITIDPDDGQTYLRRCSAYAWLGEDARALRDCTRAIELDPGLAQAYRLRGELHIRRGHPDLGREDLLKEKQLRGGGAPPKPTGTVDP